MVEGVSVVLGCSDSATTGLTCSNYGEVAHYPVAHWRPWWLVELVARDEVEVWKVEVEVWVR